jgi:hypothetical protein
MNRWLESICSGPPIIGGHKTTANYFSVLVTGNCCMFREHHPMYEKAGGGSAAALSSCEEHWQHGFREQVQ